MRSNGSLRLFRSVLLTSVMFSLATAGHMLGGGALPAPAIMAALTVLLLLPVTVLARRQLSYPTLLTVLAGGQLLLHEAFAALSMTGPAPCRSSPAMEPLHHGGRPDCVSPGTAAPDLAAGLEGGSVAMLTGHVLATIVTASAFHSGESALWQLMAWLRPLLRIPRPARPLPSLLRVFTPRVRVLPPPWRNLRPDSLRGPPRVQLPHARSAS